MPIFTQPISQQNTGYSAGVKSYPGLGAGQQYTIISDEFNRETLTPTGGYTNYTTAVDAGGTAGIYTLSQLRMITDVNNGNQSQCRTSGISFTRTAFVDQRKNLNFNIGFTVGQSTLNQGFVGLINNSGAALSGIPTTAQSLGVYWDTSADTHYHLTSGNGSTQVKTDTGLALDGASTFNLNINWIGDDSATISLYNLGTGPWTFPGTQVGSTQTVTSLANGSVSQIFGMQLYFYVKTLTTAARVLYIQEWTCTIT